MGNPINDAVENLNKTIHDMRSTNDQSLDELKKGNEVKFRELQEKCDKQESLITELTKARNDAIRVKAITDERIDLLEALADRPKGDVVKKLYNEDEQLFFKQIRAIHNGGDYRSVQSQREALRSFIVSKAPRP